MGFTGFAAAGVAESLPLQILCLCLALMGVYGSFPVFWTLPTAFLTGTAAAAGIALVNFLWQPGRLLRSAGRRLADKGRRRLRPGADRARRVDARPCSRRHRTAINAALAPRRSGGDAIAGLLPRPGLRDQSDDSVDDR